MAVRNLPRVPRNLSRTPTTTKTRPAIFRERIPLRHAQERKPRPKKTATRYTKSERERIRVEAIKSRLRSEPEPKTLLLLITAADIPTAPRGELVWTGAGAECRLFYDIGRTGDLHLYGVPIYVKSIPMRRGYKKPLWCTECRRWTDRLFVLAAQGNNPWCPTCFKQGTPSQHQHIQMGTTWPVKWPVELWGNQDPLRIAAATPKRKKPSNK